MLKYNYFHKNRLPAHVTLSLPISSSTQNIEEDNKNEWQHDSKKQSMNVYIDDSGTPAFTDPQNKSLGLTAILTNEEDTLREKFVYLCQKYQRDSGMIKWKKTTHPRQFREEFFKEVISATDVKIVHYYQDRDTVSATIWDELKKDNQAYYLTVGQGLVEQIINNLNETPTKIFHDTFGTNETSALIQNTYEEMFKRSTKSLYEFQFVSPSNEPLISVVDLIGGMLRELDEHYASMTIVLDEKTIEQKGNTVPLSHPYLEKYIPIIQGKILDSRLLTFAPKGI